MLASIPASIFNVVWKLGSTGGLVYLANIFRNRVRVRVRLLAEDFYSDSPPSVKFEAENIGMTPTSIEPIVHFRGYLPRPQGEKQKFKTRMELYELVLHLDGHQRSLEPFKPLPFEVKNEKVSRNVSAKLGFMFFKTYTFSFTR